MLLITVNDGRRRPASAVLASSQGFRRTHKHQALTTAHKQRLHKVQRYLLSSKYQMVCALGQTGSQTIDRQCILHRKGFSLSFLMLPRMQHEHTCALDELVYFLCDHCAVITVKMLPGRFCEWKMEPEKQ